MRKRWNASGRYLAADAQPGEPALERRGFEAEAFGRAAAPAHAAVGALEHGPDMVEFEGSQRLGSAGQGRGRRAGCRHDELAVVGEDHGAFDDVTQLADVPRPRVALQLLQ